MKRILILCHGTWNRPDEWMGRGAQRGHRPRVTATEEAKVCASMGTMARN
jgi:hypothetical protein